MIQLLGVIDMTKHYRDVVFFDHSRQRIPQLSESHRERWDVDHPVLTCSWLVTRRIRQFKQSASASSYSQHPLVHTVSVRVSCAANTTNGKRP
jgi:hypothetical protein